MKAPVHVLDWRRPAQITVLTTVVILAMIPVAASLAWIFSLWAPVPPLGKLPHAIAVLQRSASAFAVARHVLQPRGNSDDDSLT
jgi:hypothetical protein